MDCSTSPQQSGPGKVGTFVCKNAACDYGDIESCEQAHLVNKTTMTPKKCVKSV